MGQKKISLFSGLRGLIGEELHQCEELHQGAELRQVEELHQGVEL